MKTVITIILSILITSILGYLLGPKLIERELKTLREEISMLQARLQASETFIKAEEEARQTTGLKADTRLPDVVKTVNRLATGQKSMEDLMQVRFADFDARLSEMKAATEGGMSKLFQQSEEGRKNTEKAFQGSALRAMLGDARIRVIKIKNELVARNIGVAKGEIDLLSQALEDTKGLIGDNNEKKIAIEKLQAMAKEIKTEMDGNLVAAMDRIDLLWHDLAKLSVSG